MSMNRIGLLLEPLDVLFFRDGRPFGAATHGQSGLPLPQTLSGAIWTALLERYDADLSRLGAEVRGGASFEDALATIGRPRWLAQVGVRGPWLARTRDSVLSDVLVPVPAVLQQVKSGEPGANGDAGKLRRLQPLADRLPGWEPPLPGMQPLWLRDSQATEAVAGFLGREGLSAFLSESDAYTSQVTNTSELYDLDSRTGIAIDTESQTAEEGLIYGARFLALNKDVAFYAEVELPAEADRDVFSDGGTLAFGGERRQVRVCRQPRPWEWPNFKPTDAGQKPLLLLATPGLFAERWYPRVCTGRLAAAAVPGDQPVSGWDLARGGPKPARFAARAGSVYFLNEPLDPQPTALSDEPFDRQQGWGCYLQGVWTDE